MASVPDPFYLAIAPIRDAVSDLIDAAQPFVDLPSASSIGMAELSRQGELAGGWGDEPVQHAHVLGVWRRYVAVDCAEALVRDLQGDPAPVYAFKVLSRAVLENAAAAAYLLDPNVTLVDRVARGRNERIHSAREVLKLPWLPVQVRQEAEERVSQIHSTARDLGIVVTQEGWLVERRPGFTALLRWSLGDTLGATLANYYSAVAHGSQYGMVSAVLGVQDATSLHRPRRAALGLASSDVNLALAVSGLSLIRALDNERVLMGRDWATWEAVRQQSLTRFEEAARPIA